MSIDRREFLKMCALLGISLPVGSALQGCRSKAPRTDLQGPVLIIGAGAAGLTAGYLLEQLEVEYRILEAAPEVGGRMKRTTEFADFPIPLGAEWIHVPPDILTEIVNNPTVNVDIDTTRYDPKSDFLLFQGERISLKDADFTEDSKFIHATWFDFYERYILPSVQDHIQVGTVVEEIDSSADPVQVRTREATYTGTHVIVTVPVKRLQQNAIRFTPPLPKQKQAAIRNVQVWDGCKAFIEFSKPFYPALVGFDIHPKTAGQKLYYDAAYGQKTDRHILGLFAVGTATRPYVDLEDAKLIRYMLQELDDLFEGQASRHYVKHLFQNWNAEPFVQGAYVMDHENWKRVRTLGTPVGDRLFFAGDAYTDGLDWGSVHTAARSARRAVNAMTRT